MADSTEVILLCRDLLLASKVRLAAERAGIPLRVVRDPGALLGVSGVGTTPGKPGANGSEVVGNRLIVDCNLEGALGVVLGFKLREGAGVIGFVAHTDAATVAAARAAGVDQVMARSAFFADPERVMTRFLASPPISL